MRHKATGAKLVEFAAGRCPCNNEGCARGAHGRALRAAASSTSATWASRNERSGGARALQRLLSNDVAKIQIGGAQYSVLCARRSVLDDLFTYRLDA